MANIQSLKNKLPEIQNFSDKYRIDILIFTETWITPEHHMIEIKLKGYQQPMCHIRKYGGVVVYVREGLAFKQLFTKSECNDAVWFELANDTFPTLFGCIYRSPNSTDSNNSKMIDAFQEIHDKYSRGRNFIITGDLNLPHVNWQNYTGSNPTERKFIKCWQDMYLEQMVTKPTRYRHDQTPSLLDVILTNFPETVSNISHHPGFGNSDHEAIRFDIEAASKSTEERPKLDYYCVNESSFRHQLATTNWFRILYGSETDFEISGKTFSDRMQEIINDTVPYSKHNSRNKPWFTNNLKRLYRRKERTWKKVQEHGTAEHWRKFREARKVFNSKKDQEIFKYEDRIISGKKSNIKRYYKYLSSKNPFPKNELNLIEDGKTEIDPRECGNILKKVFKESFSNPSDHEVIPRGLFHRDAEITDMLFTRSDVEEKLRRLKTPKSPGPDLMSNVLLKKFSYELSYPLFLLFRKMCETGTIPKCYKHAIVIPIFKKGSKQDPRNYRPVSLTSCILKVFEKLLLDKMKDFISCENLMTPHQHGFCNSRSTLTNLLSFWHEVTNLADAHSQISIIYTDMSKAFYKIPHNYLIAKLDCYGFRGTILSLLKSYLHDRTQQVSVKGVLSETMEVNSGTPQGGVLSGILFALYVNDLPNVIKHARVFIYADDVKLLMAVNSNDDMRNLQRDIDAKAEWCDSWGLPMNPEKCNYIHYSPRNCATPVLTSYSIKGIEIQKTSTVKDLGVTITDNLKFNEHIDLTVKKVNSEIGRARRSFKCRKLIFLSDLFTTYIRPNLEYCTQLWNPVHSTLIDKLEKTQNRFTRLIPDGRNLSHEERNRRLNITTHEERRLRGDMVFAWEILDNTDHPCKHMLTPDTNSTTRGHSKKLTKKRFSNDIAKQSFTNRIINKWNSLDEEVISSSSQNMFKKRYDSSV